ncbi:MAG: T9SS type A sorting domain-containing protein [Bacteroidota bacterium]
MKHYVFLCCFFCINAIVGNAHQAQDTSNIWQVMTGPYGGSADLIALDSSGGVYTGTLVGAYRFNEDTEKWTLLGFKGQYIENIITRPNGDVCIFSGTSIGIYNPINSTWTEYKPKIKVPDGSNDSISLRGNSVAIIDSNIYVANYNWIYHSTDAIHWKLINAPEITGNSSPVIVVSKNGTLILAGLTYELGVLYCSKDTGKTWEKRTIPGIGGTSGISDFEPRFMQADNNGRIYLGGAGSYGGILRSEDNGVTWKRITTRSTTMFSMLPTGQMLCNSNQGAIFSSDWGDTWKELYPYSTSFIGVIRGDGRIYGVVINDIKQIDLSSEIIRSDDKGKNWKRWPLGYYSVSFTAITTLADGSLLGGGKWRSTDEKTWEPYAEKNYKIADENVINAYGEVFAAASDGVYKTQDMGKTWSKVFSDMYGTKDIAINKRGWIYAIGEAAIWWSKDRGATWEANLGSLRGRNTVACDYQGWIYAGYRMDSLVRSENFGETWENIPIGSIENNPFVHYDISFDRNHRVLVGTFFEALLRSFDSKGTDYTKLAGNLNSAIDRISVDSSDNIYIRGTDFWQSIDKGQTWKYITGNDINIVEGSSAYPAPSGYVYVGAQTGTYKSSIKHQVAPFVIATEQGCGYYTILLVGDTLRSVDVVSSGLFNIKVSFDTITPKKSIRVKCTLIDNSKPGRFGIRAVNTNGKETLYEDIIFTPLAAPIITPNGKTLMSNPSRKYQWFMNDSLLYSDTAQTYKPKKSGTYKVRITDTNFCDAMSEPFTYSTVGIEEYTAGLTNALSQNMPNPFSDKTEISYTIAKAGKIRIAVIDVLGNTVAVLYDGFQEAGKYTAEFSTNTIPSGTYYYRLEVGGQVLTKNMSVVR